MSKALKPCPFCGGEARVYFAPGNKLNGIPCYGVACEECRVMIGTVQFGQTDFFRCEENAIEAWNRREPIDKVVEQLAELKAQEYDDSDEEPEWEDIENVYEDGRSQGRYEAYHNAIEIVKKGGVSNE